MGWMLTSFSSEELNTNGFIPVAYNTIASLILSAGLLGGYLPKKNKCQLQMVLIWGFYDASCSIYFFDEN